MSKNSEKSNKSFSVEEKVIIATKPPEELPKSDRYLDLIDDNAFDLGETLKAQLWNKLSAFIESQIKFRKPKQQSAEAVKVKRINKVRLFAGSECYVDKKKFSEKECPVEAKLPIKSRSHKTFFTRCVKCNGPIPFMRKRGRSRCVLNTKNFKNALWLMLHWDK